MKRFATILGVIAFTAPIFPGESSAQGGAARKTRTLATFDIVNDIPGVAEGITTDGHGGLYVSLFFLASLTGTDAEGKQVMVDLARYF